MYKKILWQGICSRSATNFPDFSKEIIKKNSRYKDFAMLHTKNLKSHEFEYGIFTTDSEGTTTDF